ncbi:ABC transporter substrate-binding protein [Streptomyces apocyni]|uniref:ABC transporter substrate-binding protein n=1 Tax=Streptomyces apocyni TaxID=2654677 RepID=UPI0018D16EAC|nr:ABC transporter substrate-binding protein [Streptomyces apocyni]
MFNRTRCLQVAATVASISLLTGCGVLSSGDSGDGERIVVGTTSAPSTLDPAAAWDGSWELFRNVYQTLLSFPTGGSVPEPDAAKECGFTDASSRTYRCEIRTDLSFSNGDRLDAAAVKHSIDRIKTIAVKGGPDGLLGNLDRVEAKGDHEVVFHLKEADATFPFVLATPAMSLVSPKKYPADRLREDGKVTGSGPYVLDSYEEGKSSELSGNSRYKGRATPRNDAVTIRYFQDSAEMLADLRSKKVDVAFRGLAPEDVVALQDKNSKDGLQLVEGAGMEIRYLVFDLEQTWSKKPAVRKAVAQVVDRGAIAHNIYRDTVEPLYSMVPTGLTGHTNGFLEDYGKPNAEKAEKILTDAGINEVVPLTLWYTTERYGSVTRAEFEELKRQLEKTGLFKVTLKSRPWKEYEQGYREGEYPVFGRGWSPDFPDPDNFIAPFVGERNALGTPYPAPKITDELLPKSRQESDRGAVSEYIEEAQEILVDDVRLLPLWQGKQYIAASDDIAGGERALDPSTIMMMWELQRKTSW